MTTYVVDASPGPDLSAEPLTLDVVKTHLRVESTAEDTLIAALMIAVREEAEHLTGRFFTLAARTATFDGLSEQMRLPFSPLVSVQGIDYLDADGTQQTITFGFSVSPGSPGYLFPGSASAWPEALIRPGAVTVRYTAGVAPADVPELVKAWMKLKIGALYANREAWTPGKPIEQNQFVDRLLDRYKVHFVC